jgi:hypothetical protein
MHENQEYLSAIVNLYYRRAAIEDKIKEIPKRRRLEVKKQENELENVILMIMMVESKLAMR